MSRRPEVVAYAAMLGGLGANPADPEARARYLELVAPGEAPARAAEMATMSGCALVVRGVLRAFITHPLLDAPYRVGKAMEDLTTIAREAGALHGPERLPEPGDLVLVGGGRDGGGPEHVWTALVPMPGGAWQGLDGGQRDAAGHQMVKVREHSIRNGWDAAHDDGAPGGAWRRVRHVIDIDAVLSALPSRE